MNNRFLAQVACWSLHLLFEDVKLIHRVQIWAIRFSGLNGNYVNNLEELNYFVKLSKSSTFLLHLKNEMKIFNYIAWFFSLCMLWSSDCENGAWGTVTLYEFGSLQSFLQALWIIHTVMVVFLLLLYISQVKKLYRCISYYFNLWLIRVYTHA